MDPSIVNYLKAQGQPTDYASRAQLAASKGISGYVGSAQQNTQLLNMLRGGATGAPIAQPATPQGQPTLQPVPQPVPQGAGGGDTELQQLEKTDRNPIQETRYQELVKQQRSSSQVPGQTPVFNQPSINFPEIYEGLIASSGIKDVETDLAAKTDAYNAQVAKIKDNPYLSEATMTGRLSKLKDKFNADSTLAQSNIAMKRADVETRLNLQTKQFDIQSQQAQQAISQANNMLQAGMLDNASGEDIANLTRATGISSSMWQSAISVRKKSKEKQPNTQVVQSTNDAGVVTVSVVNTDTGAIINQTSLGAIGNVQQGKQPTESEINRTAVSDMERTLSELGGEDQIVSPTEWNEARQVWIHAGYNPENFDSSFASQHINWGYNTEKYMLSPTYKKLVNPHGI